MRKRKPTINEIILKWKNDTDGTPLYRLNRIISQKTEEEPIDTNNHQEIDYQKRFDNTRKIIYQQQLLGKVRILRYVMKMTHSIGLNTHHTIKDLRLSNSAIFDIKKLLHKALHEKIEKPLHLKKEIPLKHLKKSIKAIKIIVNKFSRKKLKNMNARTIHLYTRKKNQKKLTKFIQKQTKNSNSIKYHDTK